MNGIPVYSLDDKFYPNGKYKGQPIWYICYQDPSYVAWYLKEHPNRFDLNTEARQYLDDMLILKGRTTDLDDRYDYGALGDIY